MFVDECVLVHIQMLYSNKIQIANDLNCNLYILIKYKVDKKYKNFNTMSQPSTRVQWN
jgi:hypothetical protein